MKKIITFILLIFVLLIGFLLRAQETLSHNFLFLIDQGRDMLAVRDIVYGHHLTLIGPYTSLQGVFQGPLWYYLLAIPTAIFHGDPWGAVLLMLIISMTTILVAFLVAKKLFGTIPALIIAFLFAVSPEATAAATFSWNPHPMWLLIVCYIFIFYIVISGNRKYQLFLWPIITLLFHFETALGTFFLIGTVLYLLFFDRRAYINKYFLQGSSIGLLFFLPQIIFDLRHHFLMTRSVISLFIGSKQGLFVKGENQHYSQLIQNHIATIITNFQSGFIHNGVFTILPTILFIFILLMLVVSIFIHYFSNQEKIFVYGTLRLLGIFFLLSFLYPFPLRYWFLTGFQSFYLIMSGILLAKIFSTKIGKILVFLFVAVCLVYVYQRIDLLYFHAPDYGGTAKIRGKTDAINTIYQDAHGSSFNLLVFTPPVNTDAYDYLVWMESRKYGFLPKAEKKGVFYLLIEPDPGKPWSYNGWLETVIKVGTIEKTITLPSGFIIQKRVLP